MVAAAYHAAVQATNPGASIVEHPMDYAGAGIVLGASVDRRAALPELRPPVEHEGKVGWHLLQGTNGFRFSLWWTGAGWCGAQNQPLQTPASLSIFGYLYVGPVEWNADSWEREQELRAAQDEILRAANNRIAALTLTNERIATLETALREESEIAQRFADDAAGYQLQRDAALTRIAEFEADCKIYQSHIREHAALLGNQLAKVAELEAKLAVAEEAIEFGAAALGSFSAHQMPAAQSNSARPAILPTGWRYIVYTNALSRDDGATLAASPDPAVWKRQVDDFESHEGPQWKRTAPPANVSHETAPLPSAAMKGWAS